jgi:hypothetical protein
MIGGLGKDNKIGLTVSGEFVHVEELIGVEH